MTENTDEFYIAPDRDAKDALKHWMNDSTVMVLDEYAQYSGFYVSSLECGGYHIAQRAGVTPKEALDAIIEARRPDGMHIKIYYISKTQYQKELEAHKAHLKATHEWSYVMIFRYNQDVCGWGETFGDALRMARANHPEIEYPDNPDSYTDYRIANDGDITYSDDVQYYMYKKFESGKNYRFRRTTEYDIRANALQSAGIPVPLVGIMIE